MQTQTGAERRAALSAGAGACSTREGQLPQNGREHVGRGRQHMCRAARGTHREYVRGQGGQQMGNGQRLRGAAHGRSGLHGEEAQPHNSVMGARSRKE